MNEQILYKRLSHIKQLFNIGIGQSQQHENIAVFSVLTFHDSIEMFLKLLAEKEGVNSSKFSFLDYWGKIPDLTLKESMRALNARRVNLKHKGLLPAKSEVEISKVNAIDFFNQNTKRHFGIEFKDISLIELINYEKVKNYLTKSQDLLNGNKTRESIHYSALAFEELLNSYENNKSSWEGSLFSVGEDMTLMNSFFLGIESRNASDDLKKISGFFDAVQKSIIALQRAVRINSFGLDYKEYVKFSILTPVVLRSFGGQVQYEMFGERKWTIENCQYCIDFVVKSALNLQEFDFDIQSLRME